MKVHRWDATPVEPLNERLTRRVLHTERMTVARLVLTKGAHVPRHHHENEQVAMVHSGRLRFVFDDGEAVVGAEETVVIPSLASHSVDALEDSIVTDLFAGPREDWIRGDDAYLRGETTRTPSGRTA